MVEQLPMWIPNVACSGQTHSQPMRRATTGDDSSWVAINVLDHALATARQQDSMTVLKSVSERAVPDATRRTAGARLRS